MKLNEKNIKNNKSNKKTKNKKIVILLILVVIVIISISVICIINYSLSDSQEKTEYLYESNYDERYDETGAIRPLEYLEDGEKFVTNTNAKALDDNKEIKGYVLSNFKMIKSEPKDKILIEIKNNTQEEQTEKEIEIKLVDNNKNEVDKITIVIPTLQANESVVLTGFLNCEAEKIFDYDVKF